jgi:hypothetical protein
MEILVSRAFMPLCSRLYTVRKRTAFHMLHYCCE